jgi:choice-of-anchor B domain-containing protein
MQTFSNRTGAIRVAAGLGIGIGVCAMISSAHDEDWRKLVDSLTRFEGPMITAANMGDLGPAGDFPADGLELYAWIPLNQMPGNHDQGNDCWGYVSPSGREYAIYGGANGYVFVEITDPGSPSIIGFVQGPNSTWHDVKIIGDHAYGVSEAGSGIQVMDLSNIDAGEVIHVGNVTNQGHSSTHNIASNPDSGYLYLCGGNVGNGGLVAVSLANPDAPVLAGGWTDAYVHDAQIVTYTEGKYAGKEIAFCCCGTAGFRIVDVTDKDDMHTIGQIFYPGQGYGHQGWLSEDRTLFYLDDEFDEGDGIVQSTTTHVFDVTDLSNPDHIATFTNGSDAIDHNLYVRGNLIFEANYRSGLRVYDAGEDPLAPTEIAYFDTYPENDNTSYNGAWSTYPFFPSGTVIVSDREKGLFILNLLVGNCSADFNNDGNLDILDFIAFQNAFVAGEDSADFDGNGEKNILDFVAFQNAFKEGCP